MSNANASAHADLEAQMAAHNAVIGAFLAGSSSAYAAQARHSGKVSPNHEQGDQPAVLIDQETAAIAANAIKSPPPPRRTPRHSKVSVSEHASQAPSSSSSPLRNPVLIAPPPVRPAETSKWTPVVPLYHDPCVGGLRLLDMQEALPHLFTSFSFGMLGDLGQIRAPSSTSLASSDTD
ncbi:hypothetical protein BC831DRAFT_552140 [Entophlyctis helioformis]|nr:hypothetical protein BC831DRAFT_552140 [Entophlyctis helioformis]